MEEQIEDFDHLVADILGEEALTTDDLEAMALELAFVIELGPLVRQAISEETER